jgi:hypothetical protein
VLIGREISHEIDLLESVTESLNGISGSELQCIFRSWVERVEKLIEAGGIICPRKSSHRPCFILDRLVYG